MGEQRVIAKAAGVVGGATLLSRVFGFIRDMIVAQFFGTGMATDAFFVAFRIPNLLRRLVGEGALTASFIPVYTEYITQRPREEGNEFVKASFSILAVVLLLLTGLGILLAPWIVKVMAYGFSQEPGKVRVDRIAHPPDVPLYLFYRPGGFGHGGIEFLEAFLCSRPGPGPFESVHHLLRPGFLPIFPEPVYALALGVLLGGSPSFFCKCLS